MAIRVVVAGSLEDHAVLKYALSSAMPDAEVEVGTDGYRALELARRTHPDIVVVDPEVPGLNGPELVQRIKEESSGAAVMCWVGTPDVDVASELVRAGAAGYLLKDDGPKDLVRQIPSVMDGGIVIAPSVASRLATRFAQSIHRESELTRTLAETTKQLQEIASEKDQFVANVNHELRTPVTIVKGIAHLLKSGRLSEEDQAQFVERMDAAVEKLTGMVDEILSVSDIGRGQISLKPAQTDMADLLHQVCERMQETYPDVTVERHVLGSFHVWVDAGRMSEAMAQLVDNACRYSPNGGRVVVSLRRAAEGVMFAVTDSGEGLPREVLNKAFREPFVTGEEILRKEKAGLGVGLHLARQLIVLHGGIMWADPLPSGGTRVAFCIPEHSPLFDPAPVATLEEPSETVPDEDAEVASLLQQLLQE